MARTHKDVDKARPPIEIGSTGLKMYDGFSHEEFLPQLRGHKAVQQYKEMSDNDSVIGGILFIIDMTLRNVKWSTIPADNSPEAIEVAKFFEECRNDMEQSWEDLISEILSMLVFGWSAHEIVYKVRKGTNSNSNYSKFDDGKIGWKKLPIRSQDSLYKWEQKNGYGKVIAMIQQTDYNPKTVTIPMDKLLIFRPKVYKDSPEGRSILRNAYRSWFFKKRMEEIEGIGVERDLAGLPIAYVPPELLSEDATTPQKNTLQQIKDLVRNIKRDEQEGAVFPLLFDEDGNQLYKLELLSTGGQRQFDTSEIITRYDSRMAMSLLADFMLLGHSSVGSFALSKDKTANFSKALGAWLKQISSVFNTKAIPKLMRMNGFDMKLMPYYEPEDVTKLEVTKFANAIQALVSVGALTPENKLEAKIRDMIELEHITPQERQQAESDNADDNNEDDETPTNSVNSNGLGMGQTNSDIVGE